METTEAIQHHIDSLRHQDPIVRRNSADSLGAIKDPTAVPALCEALHDHAESVRSAAAFALGAIKDPAAIPALRKALLDNSSLVELQASSALVKIGVASVLALCDEDFYMDDRYDPRKEDRIAAALREFKDPAIVPALCQAIQDPDSKMRRQAASALGAIKDPVAVPALYHALQDPDAHVASQAVSALGAIKDPTAVAALCQALQDPDSEVRWHVALALGRMDDASAVAALCQALQDPNSPVRGCAALALENMGDFTSLPHKVIAAVAISAADRIGILEAMGKASSKWGAPVKYKVLPVVRYCQSLLQRDDVAEEIKAGAREILAEKMLLRPGARDVASEPIELLRAASASDATTAPEEALRSSNAPEATAPSKQTRQQRTLWDKIVGRT